jgi:hypothetical protein
MLAKLKTSRLLSIDITKLVQTRRTQGKPSTNFDPSFYMSMAEVLPTDTPG